MPAAGAGAPLAADVQHGMEEIDQDRRLATIETVTDVVPIEGADFIELVQARGWRVVVRKDQEFKPGDLCIYLSEP